MDLAETQEEKSCAGKRQQQFNTARNRSVESRVWREVLEGACSRLCGTVIPGGGLEGGVTHCFKPLRMKVDFVVR
jgi:hypothetical protein